MKWPNVEAARWQARAELAQQMAAELRADLAAERARYDALVDKLREMQRIGFQAPAPLPDAPVSNRLDPRIEAAIADHMDPSGPTARQTVRMVRGWLAQNATIDDICNRIHAGAGADDE